MFKNPRGITFQQKKAMAMVRWHGHMAMVRRHGHMAMVRRQGHGHGPVARVKGIHLFNLWDWGRDENKTQSTLSPDSVGRRGQLTLTIVPH